MNIGMDSWTERHSLIVGFAAVVLILAILLTQESIEWRAFLYPEQPWQALHLGLGGALEMLTGPATL